LGRDGARGALVVGGFALSLSGGLPGRLLRDALKVEPPRPPRRVPWLRDGETVSVLDQRRLPEEAWLTLSRPQDAARAIRDGAIVGPHLAAIIAAEGVWLAARQAGAVEPFARRGVLLGGCTALRAADPDVASIEWAVSHVADRTLAALDGEESPTAAARDACDEVIAMLTADESQLAAAGAGGLPATVRPLEILTLGSTGALSGARWGTALAVIATAAQSRPMRVWVLETQPSGAGQRIAAPELCDLNVDARVIPDASAAWLMADRTIDVALVGCDRITSDGSVLGVLGTRTLAELAQHHGVPFWVATSTRFVDLPTAEVAGTTLAWESGPPSRDETPIELIGPLVTERGVLSAGDLSKWATH
jgi:methylthioribose-1-phosphate isomerase